MFINPFKKHTVDEFPGVHVPLEEPVPSGPNVPDHQSNSPTLSEKDAKDDKSARPESDASSGVVNHGMTLAALKAEIEADVAASGTDTPYDRKSKVINRALEDMGMGRYQWKLFILAGCGWMADNLWLQVCKICAYCCHLGLPLSRVSHSHYLNSR
jgi:hypothetical protein